MNINNYICTGRLTKDPELRKISVEMSVCALRLEVDGMGRGREVGYINVSVFGSGGEAAAKHLTKGWLVAVDGRVEYGEWDKDAGGSRAARERHLLGSARCRSPEGGVMQTERDAEIVSWLGRIGAASAENVDGPLRYGPQLGP